MALGIFRGTGTLSATTGGPGDIPSVTVTATLTPTDTVFVTPKNTVRDSYGAPINLVASLTSSGATGVITVYADRQIPAGQEIDFDWVVLTGTT